MLRYGDALNAGGMRSVVRGARDGIGGAAAQSFLVGSEVPAAAAHAQVRAAAGARLMLPIMPILAIWCCHLRLMH